LAAATAAYPLPAIRSTLAPILALVYSLRRKLILGGTLFS
jgi:hypothetical protein